MIRSQSTALFRVGWMDGRWGGWVGAIGCVSAKTLFEAEAASFAYVLVSDPHIIAF